MIRIGRQMAVQWAFGFRSRARRAAKADGFRLESLQRPTVLSPSLNIQIDKQLIGTHNDIWQMEIIAFVRDLIAISTTPISAEKQREAHRFGHVALRGEGRRPASEWPAPAESPLQDRDAPDRCRGVNASRSGNDIVQGMTPGPIPAAPCLHCAGASVYGRSL